jgi:rhamnosyltransferase
MNCSLVIRAYNEEKHIRRLLEGIRHQTLKDVEIILVDSGSTDQTVSIAESFGAQVVRIAPDEFTFGRSLNFGIRAATCELIVIASAHVYPVYQDWLETLLRPFENQQVAITSGKQRGPGAAKYSEQQIFHQWYPDTSKPKQETAFCNNANAAIRKSLWEKHPYDETLTGLEDIAWAKWAKEQGYDIAYVAEAEVIHIHNETARGVFNRYCRESMAFKKIYPESHFNIYDFARLTTMNILSDVWHAARDRVLLKSVMSIFWFRFMQFHGTRMGYRDTSLITPQLRETFYYAREKKSKEGKMREIEPIRYNAQDLEMDKSWKFAGMSQDSDKFKLKGIAIWSHEWQPLTGRFAKVRDPAYGQQFEFQVYMIEDGDNRIEFATGEFSSNVWGVYVQE